MSKTHWGRAGAAVWGALALWLLGARAAHAAPQEMHIVEGFLPPAWCALWFAVAVPFWLLGFARLRRLVAEQPEARLLLGLSGAFMFALSALKLPSVTGSSSHPTGTGLGALLFGPAVVSVLGTLVLLFQALLLAHGGITTLGANAVSMAIAGPAVGWAIWAALRGRAPLWLAAFLAAALADLSTYLVTSAQLALAYPDPQGGVLGSFATFAALFGLTQVPLAISEGILTVLVLNALRGAASEELRALGV